MARKILASYLRTYRKRSGLTQRELARILGYAHGGPVSQHEQSGNAPSLFTALAYQVIFRVPLSDIFPELCKMIEETIETRLAEFEKTLGSKSAKDRNADQTAAKLQWLCMRRSNIDS